MWTGKQFELNFLLILLSIFFFFKTSWAQVSDWKPGLLPPSQKEFRTPTDKFRIFIPPEVPIEVLQRLSLEMDGIDVTKMVGREGEFVLFVPPQPLEWGKHTLRLVENAPDGNIIERGLWTFEVRKTARFREAELRTGLDFIDARRMAENDLDGLPVRNQAQGSLGVSGTVADENWRASVRADFLYDSQSDNTSNNREFDMGGYLFTGKLGSSQVDMGDLSIEPESMVMQGFNRRGVSASLLPENRLAKVTAFNMRTDTITGFQNGLGINDSDNRTYGVVGAFNPFSAEPEKLYLSAVYLKGDGGEAGEGIGGDPTASDGDALSVIADSRIFGQRIRLRGEFAQTRYNFAGGAPGFSDESAYANTLFAAYTHPGQSIGDSTLFWDIGFNYQRVGTFFYSLANSGLPADVRHLSVFSNINWADLSVNATFAREQDNVDDDVALPRIQTDKITVDANYTPFQEVTAEDKLSIFDQPSFNGFINLTKQKQTGTPSGFSGRVTDELTSVFDLSAYFTPGTWNWGIGHTATLFNDKSGVLSDYQNYFTSFNAGFQIGDRLSLTPDAEWNVFKDKDTGVKTTDWRGGFGIVFDLIPGKLNGSLNPYLRWISASDDFVDAREKGIDGGLVWSVRQAQNNWPGASLFVNGNYQSIDDSVTPDAGTDNYQVFAGINISWPVAY